MYAHGSYVNTNQIDGPFSGENREHVNSLHGRATGNGVGTLGIAVFMGCVLFGRPNVERNKPIFGCIMVYHNTMPIL